MKIALGRTFEIEITRHMLYARLGKQDLFLTIEDRALVFMRNERTWRFGSELTA